MSEIKLFSINSKVEEKIPANAKDILEKELQSLIEKNMETFFGVKFLKSEWAISEGRMDSIGIDENNSPVIFEYKRSLNENVINQGLFYLDWLLDHKADFKLLVIDVLGNDVADQIDWSVPGVYCIAHDFTRYDVHAVKQMTRNIKLVSYRKYGNEFILFEHINVPNVKPIIDDSDNGAGKKQLSSQSHTHVDNVASAPANIKELYDAVCEYIESLGDDIEKNQLKKYLAYKKVQNIVCVEIMILFT